MDDKKKNYIAESVETLPTYPRIWLCQPAEGLSTTYNVFLTHPEARKGDLLLEFSGNGDNVILQNMHRAMTDALHAADTTRCICMPTAWPLRL